MKKHFTKAIALIGLLLSTFSSVAQTTAPDEDTRPITTCRSGFSNTTRTSSELPNAINVGTIDDRSCYSDYSESVVNNVRWGVYNITDGSNHLGTSLQPRIERSLPRSKEVGVGSYARFTGTVRILEVGDASGTASDGTYMMQSKGKHTGGGGSPDPAICLYLVKPVIGKDSRGNDVQVSFKLYREQINFRGGSGSAGRDVVFLTDMNKNEAINIKLEVGFRQDPNDPAKRIHYSDAVIGNKVFNWDIPEPEKGVESGIRYGAYRVKGGRAQIRWTDTRYSKNDVVYDPNANTNTGTNVAPEVTLTSPANNATFALGEVINLNATASDPNGNLDKVNFQIDDTFYKTDNARPFETTFTPSEAGTYKIAARAIDKDNLRKDDFVTITVVNSNNAPTVSITSPANGATFELGQEISFSADASDTDGNLDKVNFFINDEMFRSDNERPFNSTYTPTQAGTYTILARAIDTENSKTDSTITIQVIALNQLPTASFLNPTSETIEEGYNSLYINIEANDADGEIENIVLSINDQEIRSEGAAPYEWGHEGSPDPTETVGLSAGEHVLKAVITDDKGGTVTITKTITVTTATNTEPIEYFKIRNVTTGQFLTKANSTDQSVIMSDNSDGNNTSWGFPTSGELNNIENQDSGILRATGPNFAEGAFKIVIANGNTPSADSDKIWTLHFNSINDTYRFESANSGRYLYQEADGSITHISVPENDTRSLWEVISSDVLLSTTDLVEKFNKIQIYPNPATEKFTISFNDNIALANKSIEIYTLLGNLIYKNTSVKNRLEFNTSNFKSGLYLIKTTTQEGKVFHSKLIVN